ncbi:fimbrillin family protein [Parabacteroides sp.]
MKIDRLFNKGITGMLALAGILCGCAEEDYEASQTVPLSISATCPALAGDVTTRATTTEVKIALNATAGGYAATSKTYQVASLSPSITFTPKDADNTWEVTGDLTSTPLTIYGWLDENTPVACSENSIAVNNGNISAVTLSPAYACIGVRILLGKDTEAADTYTINSSLKGIGTASTNNSWNTTGTMPVLNAASSSPGSINNTDKSTVVGINAGDLTTDYFMRVVPTTIQASTANFFTITLPNGQQLPIASGNQTITIESGNCYLFTVNIGSETSLTISSIEQMTMDLEDYIVLHPQGVVPRKVGIFTKYDWDQFINAYFSGSYDNWLDSEGVLNLYTDIDLEDEPFDSFGQYQFDFNGHGHTISNLHIYMAGSESAGFFSNLEQGYTIQGLTIDGVTIDQSEIIRDQLSSAGAIVGGMDSYAQVIDCHVKGKVTIVGVKGGYFGDGGYAGGIVGNASGLIYACTFDPDESSTISGKYMGGIAGAIADGKIVGCIAHDFNFLWDSDAQSMGGIYAEGLDGREEISSCVAYNITTNGGNGEIIGSGNNSYCYGYNVCGNSSGETGSLGDLSSGYIIGNLNQGMSGLGPSPFHFEASPTSDITGPTIKPGAAY